ncbi:hypothetical protein [Streptomyces iconiensis]|uniref:Uncharacterized protein n=1 Tax=Streptomyces iconiensis TaxID=1384038 RepID=A0ABT7A4K8_9ACTN|nr:hypothetical protein [Streptomyces iconiensis]MDJ1136280.1 hypothetical protein [Streptomyces iconiensis]
MTTVRFSSTRDGAGRIRTMQRGTVVAIRCRDCLGTGYEKS